MQQSISRGQRFWRALVKLDFISKFFTWTMELLARVTEPLASLSAIYIIICAGVPALLSVPLYTLALALIIGSPELLVIGAFKIASRELSRGNKKGGWLMAACVVLLLLTALTVGDLFVWHWGSAAVQILMGCRCLAGIAYTFTRGVVTDESELDVSQGSPVHTLLQEFTVSIQDMVNQASQQVLTEVSQSGQFTLTEVNRLVQDLHQQQQQLVALVNSLNQDMRAELQLVVEALDQQSRVALSDAVERIERANSRRLEAVYSRLEEVRVTLESNPALPAVNGPVSQFQLPARSRSHTAQQAASEPQNVRSNQVHAGSVNGENEGLDGSKVNAIRTFTVDHYRANGALPTLFMIQTAVLCSKTLASRVRGQAAVELGLKVGSGE